MVLPQPALNGQRAATETEPKVAGHDAYYGVTGNSAALSRFHREVERRWRKWLNRRNRIRTLKWEKFRAILRRYPLAPARSVRSQFRHAAKP